MSRQRTLAKLDYDLRTIYRDVRKLESDVHSNRGMSKVTQKEVLMSMAMLIEINMELIKFIKQGED